MKFFTTSTLIAILLASISMTLRADDGTWIVDADGNWSDPGNWDLGIVADGTGSFAGFSNITALRTVTLDTHRTIGNLSFSDNGSGTNRWVLSGPNTLTLDVTSGPSTINANTPTTISTVLAGNDGLRKQGFKVVQLTAANTYSGSTTINQGALQAIDGVGLPSGSNLVFNSSSSVFQSSGAFTRSLGTGAGQVQWISGGGFSAAGGPLAVRLGGNTSDVTWGSGNFVPANQSLTLSSGFADSLVDFQNGINLAGQTRTVAVLDNPSSDTDFAQISGPITNGNLNKSGSGTLILTGTNSYGNTRLSTSISDSTVQIGNGGTTGTLGTGSVTFNTSDSLVFNRSDALTVNNSMQRNGFGAKGTIIQDGTGTTTLAGDGASANQYDGALTVHRGTIVLDYNTFDSSKVGDGNAGFLTIGSAALQLVGGTHQEEVTSTSITGAATISRNSGSATLRLNSLTMAEGASLDLAVDDLADTDTTNVNGVLPGVTVGGNLAKNSTDTADGQIRALSAGDYTEVTRLDGLIADDVTTNVKIVDGGATSPVTMSAAGTTTINTLTQGASDAAAVDIGNGNTLRLSTTGTILANGGQTLSFTSGALTAGGADDIPGTLQFNHSAAIAANSQITDNGAAVVGVAKSGAGTLNLGVANTYTGKTIVNGGTLQIAEENRLGTNPASATADQLTINGGTLRTTATFALDDANRGVTLGAAGGTFSPDGGTTLTVASAIVGTTPHSMLTQSGNGAIVLTAANSYGGGTIINSGTVYANNTSGSATGTGNVIVNGGTFGGTGAISGAVSIVGTSGSDATLSPGASIESLDIGGLSMTGINSHLLAEIDLAGTLAADLLNVTGSVSLNLARLDVSFATPRSATLPLTFLLINNDGNDAINLNSQTDGFGIISNPARYAVTVNYAYTGTDALGRIGDGNDIAVTISAIPEPSGLLLASVATAALVRFRRKRNQSEV